MKLGLLFAIALAATGCREPERKTAAETTTTAAAASPSIYGLHIALRDEHGDAVSIDTFRGHPVIVSMFYGSCPSACPLIVSHVKEIEAALSPEARARTRVLLVSFDAERDTPEVLTALAEQRRVDRDRWKMATGPDDEVRQLANVLGVVYKKEPSGAFSHNSVISVLDGEGRIVARVDDPSADLAPLVKALR
jgi:protein SCO1/2